MNDKIYHQKLKKDIIQILLKEPFYAHIISNFERVFTNDIEIAGVSFVDHQFILKINPDSFFELPFGERVFILIHEILHICFEHLFFAKNKNFKIWNYATDLCINQLIPSIGTAPSFGLFLHSFENQGIKLPPLLSSEEYYEILMQELDDEQKNNDSNSSSDSFELDERSKHKTWNTNEISQNEEKIMHKNIEKIVKEASELAGKNKTPSSLLNHFSSKEKNETPWFIFFRKLLKDKYSSKTKRTWKKPHRYYNDQAMGKKKRKKFNMYVIVDTSASIKEQYLNEFQKELNTLLSFDTEIIIIECDNVIHNIYNYTTKTKLKFKGGGGTDFTPAFDVISKKEDKLISKPPNVVVCLTDGFGLVPDNFKYKTIFCITENGKKPHDSSFKEASWGAVVNIKNK